MIADNIEAERMLSSVIPPRRSTIRLRPVKWIRASSNRPAINCAVSAAVRYQSKTCSQKRTEPVSKFTIVSNASSLSARLGSRILAFISRIDFAFMIQKSGSSTIEFEREDLDASSRSTERMARCAAHMVIKPKKLPGSENEDRTINSTSRDS